MPSNYYREFLRKLPGVAIGIALWTGVFAYTVSHAQDSLRAASIETHQLPTIGDPADRILSPAEESRLGEGFLRSVYRSDAVLQDPEISSYIQHLGDKLAGGLGTGETRYTFFVVNDPAVNAFAVPGGFIGVNAGLILISNTESELAGVVSHEIAHVSQRHIARRIMDISAAQIPTLGAILAGILLASNSGSDAGQALIFAGIGAQAQQSLNFTRSNEIEADRIGLQILYKGGFDPNGMADFFRVMQRQRFGRIPNEFRFLLTHPLDNVRITEAQSRIDRLPKQPHQNSTGYEYTKARLAALISQDPKKLVDKLEKDMPLKKNSDVILQYAYSQALERNGQYDKALQVLKPLIHSDPENSAYQLAWARNAQHVGDTIGATKVLEKMLAIYPNNFGANYYYATLLKETGKAAEGRDLLKRYIRNNSAPTMDVYKLLAELHADSGEPVNSQQMLAEYYFGTGNYNAAVFQLRQALQDKELDFVTRSQLEKRLREILQITRT
jgi:predicted Zn-dependent protease